MALYKLLTAAFIIAFLAPYAPVEWKNDKNIDMGDLRHKEAATCIFEFVNTGSEALYIDNVRPSCGCTSPDWEDIYIQPDSTGQIIVEYDAEDLGYFQKSIKVYFNGYRKAERLSIEGFVE